MLQGLVAALGAAILFGVAAVLQALAARRLPPARTVDPLLLVRLLRQPPFVAALALNLLGFVLHLVALRSLPLFLAQGVIAVSLVVTALLAVRVFSDTLRTTEWLAVAGVCGGLSVLAAAAGGQGDTGRSFAGALLVVVAAIAVVGSVAARTRRPVGTALLGLVAGMGFAVVSVAVRLLHSADPAELVRDPATYALVVGGTLAFLLYTLALQRGSVTTATAPMILAQTVAPAVVGVLLLGDGVRAGWTPAAVLGFAVAAAGAVVLARFEGVS